MIGALSLRSVLLAVVIAVPSMGAGWLARGIVVDRIEIPRVIEQQSDLCIAATEKAAADAVAAEQLRQFRIGEQSTQRFYEQSQAAAYDAQAQRDLLEMEIEHYAQRVREGGSSVCALDADALDLIGVRQAAEQDR